MKMKRCFRVVMVPILTILVMLPYVLPYGAPPSFYFWLFHSFLMPHRGRCVPVFANPASRPYPASCGFKLLGPGPPLPSLLMHPPPPPLKEPPVCTPHLVEPRAQSTRTAPALASLHRQRGIAQVLQAAVGRAQLALALVPVASPTAAMIAAEMMPRGT